MSHKDDVLPVLAGDRWWPFFVTIFFFFVIDIIVLSDLIFWLNKLGVTVDIIWIYF